MYEIIYNKYGSSLAITLMKVFVFQYRRSFRSWSVCMSVTKSWQFDSLFLYQTYCYNISSILLFACEEAILTIPTRFSFFDNSKTNSKFNNYHAFSQKSLGGKTNLHKINFFYTLQSVIYFSLTRSKPYKKLLYFKAFFFKQKVEYLCFFCLQLRTWIKSD